MRAVVLTHGHEDHVGALPYLMREVRVPLVIATRLTLALVKSKLDEHGLCRSAELRELMPGDDAVELGPFRIELVRMAHSIPDAAAVVLETPGGRCVHTGDYKLDHTPVDGQRTDVGRLAELGSLGVDLSLGDSTNAERPGVTESERVVGEAFRQIFPRREGRILVSSFASNLHRMQQAADVAVDCGRKVAFVGRSMRKNANIARSLGYMDVPEDAILRPQELAELPRGQQLILCTGSQGEPMSAMTRIAYNDHPAVQVEARRHGDHLGEADPRERAARPRRDQPAREDGRRGAARGQRAGARLRPRQGGGAADDHRPRPPEGGDADARRVPDARRARAARARGRRAGGPDHPGRERQRRRAAGRRGAHRRRGRGRRHVRRRARRGRRPRRRAARPAQALRGRDPHRGGDARRAGRRRPDGTAGADRARLRRVGRAAPRRAAGGGGHGSCGS